MVKTNKVLKQKKVMNDDMEKVRNLVILLIIVVLICLGIYFLTDNMIKKENSNNKEKTTEAKIDYDIASIGTMFNRPESEYFVLLYSSKDSGTEYNSILSKYRSSDNYIKTYYIDLDKKINNSALTDTINKKPNNSNEVKVTGPTLYKIKNGKVTNCYDTLKTIEETLK